MRISQKVDYAFRAMLQLALDAPSGAPSTSARIAARAGVPEKFLESILVELRKAGLVTSRRGPEGGHRLARPADAIVAREIWEAVEGPIELSSDRSSPRRGGGIDLCMLGLWTELEVALGRVLGGATLEQLRRRADEAGSPPDFVI